LTDVQKLESDIEDLEKQKIIIEGNPFNLILGN